MSILTHMVRYIRYWLKAREPSLAVRHKIFIWDAWKAILSLDNTVIGRVELEDDCVAHTGIETARLELVIPFTNGDCVCSRAT